MRMRCHFVCMNLTFSAVGPIQIENFSFDVGWKMWYGFIYWQKHAHCQIKYYIHTPAADCTYQYSPKAIKFFSVRETCDKCENKNNIVCQHIYINHCYVGYLKVLHVTFIHAVNSNFWKWFLVSCCVAIQNFFQFVCENIVVYINKEHVITTYFPHPISPKFNIHPASFSQDWGH